MHVINDMIWLCLIMSISCCNECMNERKEMEVLWFRPCTEMFAGRSNECTYIGDSESCCVGRNISVSFCRMRVVLFNLWTSSCSTIIIKIVFLADTCSDSDFDFWILIWFWNLSLAPAQNIYLFILKILFSLDQNISSWLFCFCFLFII